MKIHCTILLFVAVWVLCGRGGVLCQESKELAVENRTPETYSEESDSIQRYERLNAYGDYTKLKLIIRSVGEYRDQGESIVVKFFVRNDSDDEVHIKGFVGGDALFLHLWKLFHSNYDEVVKTSKGEEWLLDRTKIWPRADDRYYFSEQNEGGLQYIKLPPGKEWELYQVRLSDYFDLRKPDTYELTCFVPTLINGQYYEPPLQSNTLTFRVLEASEERDWRYQGIINPPKGKEVFKQPKPPKNVFYWFDYQSSKKMLLDDTSTLYFHQHVKEQEGEK